MVSPSKHFVSKNIGVEIGKSSFNPVSNSSTSGFLNFQHINIPTIHFNRSDFLSHNVTFGIKRFLLPFKYGLHGILREMEGMELS